MSEKRDSKRRLIIENASNIFASKGFRAVTMKDIVEACGISRGGLYLYYNSVESIFLDVIKAMEEEEEKRGQDIIERLRVAGSAELLLWFCKEQKKEILKRKSSLGVALYEYAFYCRQELKSNSIKLRFETAMQVLTRILERGVENGEFSCANPQAAAENMMYAIEGMKVCARTMGISEKKVDKELVYMMSQVIEVED